MATPPAAMDVARPANGWMDGPVRFLAWPARPRSAATESSLASSSATTATPCLGTAAPILRRRSRAEHRRLRALPARLLRARAVLRRWQCRRGFRGMRRRRQSRRSGGLQPRLHAGPDLRGWNSAARARRRLRCGSGQWSPRLRMQRDLRGHRRVVQERRPAGLPALAQTLGICCESRRRFSALCRWVSAASRSCIAPFRFSMSSA